MTLGEKQELFSRCFSRLLEEAGELGYGVRIKEVQRGPVQAEWNSTHCRVRVRTTGNARRRCGRARSEHTPDGHTFKPIGIRKSLHCVGLAGDLVLSIGGKVTWEDERYEELGVFWESLHTLCCWGGRFRNVDGGHFSITHGGRK